ncbi:hypothetical protein [Flavobacterium sp.]|uniref:hypothetical protein n=1 Tax=Flavobacterium sp. TaxID=239 RepID=UPI00286B3FED|nr:hypothetical protein [Flavobacterium sp.]
MKKKLESELISIAHRILKMKSKDDVRLLQLETQKLHEKLSVLLFIEENFGDVKPTIGMTEMESKLETIYNSDPTIVSVDENQNEESVSDNKINPISIINNIMGEINADNKDQFSPIEDTEITEPLIKFEETQAVDIPTFEKKQVSIDDLLQSVSANAVFDRVDTQNTIPVEISKIVDDKLTENNFSDKKFIDIPETKEFVFEKVDASNLNDKLKKTINIGLNDKIAFEQNLFGGSSEDFNRVVSQISTFDSLSEAKVFINEMVKPDYNNWKDKEEFADRFMEIVESKFS